MTTAGRRGSSPTCSVSLAGRGGGQDMQSLSSSSGGSGVGILGMQLILLRTPLFTAFPYLTMWHLAKFTSSWAQAVQQSPDPAAWKAAKRASIARLWKHSVLHSRN